MAGGGEMRNIARFKIIKPLLLLPIGVVIFYLSSFVPDTVEKIYSQGIYRIIGQGLSIVTGVLPFSAAELVIVVISGYVIYRLFLVVYSFIKKGRSGKQSLLTFIRDLVIVVSVIYFAFVLLWGLNYQRNPFPQIASYNTGSVTVEELADVCEDLIKRSNELRDKVNEDGYGVMKLSGTRSVALKNAGEGYNEIAKKYPQLGGKYGRAKRVLSSRALSFLGLGGFYFPYTGEANVNMDMPDTSIPFTICHEMAHQRGFAREDEANFIGFLTCISNPDTEFKYSGYLNALVYAMNALYEHDKGRFSELRKMYGKGLIRDFNARKVYWQSYEGTLDRVSSSVNNVYLKANMQEEGVLSYGRMVDLLIYKYRTEKSEKNK